MIFVTGGTGLTGAHLLYQLTQNGTRVVALKRPSSNITLVEKIFRYYTRKPAPLMSRIHWVNGSLEDYAALVKHMEGAGWVYHCAGLVSFDQADKNALFSTNVLGTTHIVNAALENKARKLCFTSSVATLANPLRQEPADEEALAAADDFEFRPYYAKTKFLAELEVWRGIEEGLNALIVNPSVILGPGIWHQGSGRFFTSVYRGLSYYTGGGTGFVDVRDVAALMIQLMESDNNNQRFVLNGANLSYKELFEKIANQLQVKPPRKQASPAMTAIAWRMEALRRLITGKPPALTRSTARSAHQTSSYSAQKIHTYVNNPFTPIDETIAHAARCFLQDQQTAS